MLAVDTFMRHLRLVCNGREEIVAHIVDFMAFCVQNPGIKIRHAILFKGIEGDGKSLLGNLMTQVMGHANVKQISPKVLGTDFSDWAHGACMGVLEEIHLTGITATTSMNAIKAPITNDIDPRAPEGQGRDQRGEHDELHRLHQLQRTRCRCRTPIADGWSSSRPLQRARQARRRAAPRWSPRAWTRTWNKLHDVLNRVATSRRCGAGCWIYRAVARPSTRTATHR
jgi:hypothetical protein